jgi:F-type H+-transporting ATPase subunit delta
VIEERIALRYARSMYELAESRSETEQVLRDFQGILQFVAHSKDMHTLLSTPLVSAPKKIAIFTRILKPYVSEATFQLIVLLTRRHRENLLTYVADEYITIYHKAHNQTAVEIISAVKLADDVLIEIVSKIAEQLRTQVISKQIIKPEIIGGLQIKLGDKLYDGSIRSALRKIGREFQLDNTYL